VSREPSYYEIALTQRQVVIAFVILLTCLVAAFFSGVWVGSGGRGPQAGPLLAQSDGAGAAPAAAPGSVQATEPASAAARPGGEPSAGTEPGDAAGGATGTGDADSLRFFSEEGRQAPSARPSPTRPSAAQPSAAQPSTPRAEPGAEPRGEAAATTGPDGRRVYADPDDPRRRSNVATPVRPVPQAPELVDPRDTGPPGAGGPVIQVFSSHDQAQAQAVLDRLLLADLDAYLSPADVRGVVHYRVRLGPFRDQEQAEAVARQLRQDFQLETWITR